MRRTGTLRLLGQRVPLGGQNVNTLVFERHGPVTTASAAPISAAAPAWPT